MAFSGFPVARWVARAKVGTKSNVLIVDVGASQMLRWARRRDCKSTVSTPRIVEQS